jgi:hypothetical protein
MYTLTKKVTVFALALLMLVMSVFVPMKKAEAAMMYNNVIYANMNCTVNSAGKLQVALSALGINGKTTNIKVELYVEKKILGLFWTRVNIGYDNNTWTDSTTNISYSNTFNTDLQSSGTYRVTTTFTVSGSGGAADVIEKTGTVSY